MNMNRSAAALFGGVALVCITGVFLQFRTYSRLQTELSELAPAHQQAQELRKVNRRQSAIGREFEILRGRHTELVRLRDELAVLRLQEETKRKNAPSPSLDAPGTAPLAPGMRGPESWTNAGTQTAAATIETALWASARGDLDVLGSLIKLDPDGRARAGEYLARLPAEVRASYGSPEKFVALLLASELPLGGMQIVDQTASSADVSRVRVRLQETWGQTRDLDVLVQSSSMGCTMLANAKLVDRVARVAFAPKPP